MTRVPNIPLVLTIAIAEDPLRQAWRVLLGLRIGAGFRGAAPVNLLVPREARQARCRGAGVCRASRTLCMRTVPGELLGRATSGYTPYTRASRSGPAPEAFLPRGQRERSRMILAARWDPLGCVGWVLLGLCTKACSARKIRWSPLLRISKPAPDQGSGRCIGRCNNICDAAVTPVQAPSLRRQTRLACSTVLRY